MANPAWLTKYLTMKPEVKQIYDDLDAWKNYCRFHMISYNEADLYKSGPYKEWQEKRKRREQWRNREQASRGHGNGYQGRNPR